MSTRILAFALDEESDKDADLCSPLDLTRLMLNAVVDGGRDLQASIQRNVHRVSIPTGKVRATDFEAMSPEAVELLVRNGQNATREFFEAELRNVRSAQLGQSTLDDAEEIYSAITETLQYPTQEVLICERDTNWVYPLFPTILCWRTRGVRVRALVQSGAQGEPELYRRRLLRALGVELVERQKIPLSAYLVDPSDADAASAIVEIPYSGYYTQERRAARYFGRTDFKAIECIRDKVLGSWVEVEAQDLRPTVEGASEQEILGLLKSVRQYAHADAHLEYRNVKISSLLSLTRFVREFKARQIAPFIELLKENSIGLFSPSAVVLQGGRRSIVGPPVVERCGNDYILIEGTTRAVHCRDSGVDEIRCVVVSGVHDALPGTELLPIGQVRMSGRHVAIDRRYEGFNHSLFRHIEKSLRPPSSI